MRATCRRLSLAALVAASPLAGQTAPTPPVPSRGAALALLAALDTADRDGLRPADYPRARLRAVLAAEPVDTPTLAAVFAAAVRALAWDLAVGARDPALLDTLWPRRGVPPDLDSVVRAAAVGDPAVVLAALAPPHAEYRALRAAHAEHRLAASAGWPAVPPGGPLRAGDRGPRVAALTARLSASGDLPAEAAARDTFDADLERAVVAFQHRHGLTADGVVGPRTLAALAVPAARRARQIALNMERWRWVPRDLGERRIEVSVPDFSLTLRDAARVLLVSPVVAGRTDWPTPIAAGRLLSVVLAPAWNVPRDIALREIVPAAAADSTYLGREDIRVQDSGGAPVCADSIVWRDVTDSTWTYRLVQAPGPRNPLGGVKLVFANPHNVALHGTPDRPLLRAPVRTFSHGCVRVARALDLATLLLGDRPEWPADSIARAAADTVERVIPAPPGVMVVVAYRTAWVADDGTVQFREDVYGWDAKLAAALRR
jgi:murein L,D-transpeptidase YcbB/YkuD